MEQKVCKNCQGANAQKAKFCSHCGQPLAERVREKAELTLQKKPHAASRERIEATPSLLDEEREVLAPIPKPTQEEREGLAQKPVPKQEEPIVAAKRPVQPKSKWGYVMAAGIIALFAGGIALLGGNDEQPTETAAVEEATVLDKASLQAVFAQRDIAQLYEFIVMPDDVMADEAAIKRYLEQVDWEALRARVEAALQKDDPAGTVIYDPLYEQALFTIVEGDGQYAVELIGHETKIKAGLPNMTLHVLGQSAVVQESEQPFARMVFGIYDTRITGTTNIADVDIKQQQTLPNALGYVLSTSFDTYTISYSSNVPNMSISVNGYEGYSAPGVAYPQVIRDIPVGTTVQVYGFYTENGQTIQSDVYELNEEAELVIEFPTVVAEEPEEDVYSEMQEVAYEVAGTFLSIYESGAIEELATIVQPNTAFYTSHRSYMERLAEEGIRVTVETFYLQDIAKLADGQYTITIEEHYTIDNPAKPLANVVQQSRYTIAQQASGLYQITGLEILN